MDKPILKYDMRIPTDDEALEAFLSAWARLDVYGIKLDRETIERYATADRVHECESGCMCPYCWSG